MKKSGWISFCGWGAIALIFFGIACELLRNAETKGSLMAEVGFLAVVFAVPSFGLWALGTLVHRFRVGGAKLKAQAMVEAQARMAGRGCALCHKQAAVVVCTGHGLALCPSCWGRHHTEACTYSHVAAPAKAPVAMVG